MKDFGFFRTAAAVNIVRLADTRYNAEQICSLISEAYGKGVSLIVFPELSVTGATCGDLFNQSFLLNGAEEAIAQITDFSRGRSIISVVGAPVAFHGRLYNCGIVIQNGNIKGIVPKINADGVFASGADFLNRSHAGSYPLLENGKDTIREGFCAEIRYAGQRCNISPDFLFETGEATFAIEIGTDMWSPIPLSAYHCLAGAQIIASPASDKEILMKETYRRGLLEQNSARCHAARIYASSGYGESSTDHVYAGAASIWENGECLNENERFSRTASLLIADVDLERLEHIRRISGTFNGISPDGSKGTDNYRHYSRLRLGQPSATDFADKLYRHIETHPFTPEEDLEYRCKEILEIQATGLMRRLEQVRCNTAVIGISGGLDSTLALLVTVLACDRLGWSRERIIGITMPGYGTTVRTKSNADCLMETLGITAKEISITAACDQHFKDLGHDKNVHDATYENSQARERTQILMDTANQTNGLVVGTGDLSELALGWATYNGDHMSMYCVNGGVPKTLVRSLVKWAAENMFDESVHATLMDIVDTPISPELLPADEKGEIQQVTEDLVGPYELHDFFIYNFMRNGYSPEKIQFLAERAFEGTYDEDTIKKWLKTFIRRFFNQQFKRSCLPDGPAVGSVSLSPRDGWHMPSDASSTMLL